MSISASFLAASLMATSLMVAPAPADAAAHAPACTSPTVVNDGLIVVRCFPLIPAKQFPPAGQKCSHIDAWTTGHSVQVVNGQTYRITQKVRDDVWICRG